MKAEQVIALINSLDPEERKTVVQSIFLSHISSLHEDGELEQHLGAALEADGLGLLVVGPGRRSVWRFVYNKSSRSAKRQLDVVTNKIEEAIADDPEFRMVPPSS